MKCGANTAEDMSSDGRDTERATVATYVPAYQKAEWAKHADRMGMTQSEFVRTMVQAGRREFGVPDSGHADDATAEAESPQPTESKADGVEQQVTETLSTGEYLSWDELVASLTDDIESRLDQTLQELQSADVVTYSGQHGGYALTDGDGR
jgi:antitoxin component of RelBE/YafQ-DinJ toxin-antitoxin module